MGGEAQDLTSSEGSRRNMLAGSARKAIRWPHGCRQTAGVEQGKARPRRAGRAGPLVMERADAGNEVSRLETADDGASGRWPAAAGEAYDAAVTRCWQHSVRRRRWLGLSQPNACCEWNEVTASHTATRLPGRPSRAEHSVVREVWDGGIRMREPCKPPRRRDGVSGRGVRIPLEVRGHRKRPPGKALQSWKRPPSKQQLGRCPMRRTVFLLEQRSRPAQRLLEASRSPNLAGLT